MTAFRPAQSPPLVSRPIRFAMPPPASFASSQRSGSLAQDQRGFNFRLPGRSCNIKRNVDEELMNAGWPSEEEIALLRDRLTALKSEHRDLDEVIARVSEGGVYDQLMMQRLKKRKLALKDQIAKIESQLLPDIIA